MNYKRYKLIVIIISIITFMLSVYTSKPEGYKFIFVIPGIFLLLFLFSKKLHVYSSRFNGLFILNFYMFIKYSISILLICVLNNYDLPGYYYHDIATSSYRMAIVYIIIEMLAIFFVIEFFSDKFYATSFKLYDMKDSDYYNKIKIGPILFLFIIFLLGLIAMNWKEFISKNLIIFSKENALTENIVVSNFNSVMFNSIKIIVMGLLVNKWICSYQKNQKIIYIILSYLIMIIYTFLSISTSRLNMILPFLLFILLTKDIFGKRALVLNIIGIIGLIVCFAVVSTYKTPWMYSSDDNATTIVVKFSSLVQEYTSNIMPTAMGLQAIHYYKNIIGIDTLFYDFFGSIPIISHGISDSNRIYTLYNMYALNGSSNSQLIPMTVSSIAYFSSMFCWVLVVVNVILLMYCESHIHLHYDNFLQNYLLLYLYFVFASCLCANVQMLSGRFFTIFLPSFIILYLNKKIVLRKESKLRNNI